MISQKINYFEEANAITKLLKEKFVNENGILIQGYADGKRISTEIVDDFGDAAPFIALYGGEDICSNHLTYLKLQKPYKNFTKAFEFTDLILGLVWYSRVGKESGKSIELAEEIIEYFENNWQISSKIISSKIRGIKIPIVNGIDSTFIEVYTELFRSTKKEKYLKTAVEVFNQFYKIRNKNNLLQKNTLLFLNLKKGVKVMKDNTNFCYGLLDLYRITKNDDAKLALQEVCEELMRSYKENLFSNDMSQSVIELTPSFAFLDVLCDAYIETGESAYLERAQFVADSWLALQSSETGLLPLFSDQKESYFDCETDMYVSLAKTYEITSDTKYKIAADRVLTGIFDHHKKTDGYVLKVDIDTGKVTNDSYKTKFIALFIKALILASSETKIYEDEKLFMLLKDR